MPLQPSVKKVAATEFAITQQWDAENTESDDTLLLTLTDQEIRQFTDLYEEVMLGNPDRIPSAKKFAWKRRRAVTI